MTCTEKLEMLLQEINLLGNVLLKPVALVDVKVPTILLQ